MDRTAVRNPCTDVILPITNQDMQHIIDGSKMHDFRKFLLQPTVQRIWFYELTPHSHIAYLAEVGPACNAAALLPWDGLGNQEFNERRRQGVESSYAYPIRSVYRIREGPVMLGDLKARYAMTGPPKGVVYLKEEMGMDVPWSLQERILVRTETREDVSFAWYVPPPRKVRVALPEVWQEEDVMDVDEDEMPVSEPMRVPASWDECRPSKRGHSDDEVVFETLQKRLRSY